MCLLTALPIYGATFLMHHSNHFYTNTDMIWQRHLNCIPSWFIYPWAAKTIQLYVQHRNDVFRSHHLIEWKAVGVTWQWFILLSVVVKVNFGEERQGFIYLPSSVPFLLMNQWHTDNSWIGNRQNEILGYCLQYTSHRKSYSKSIYVIPWMTTLLSLLVS